MQVNDKQKQISKLLWDFQSLREEHVYKLCNCEEKDINFLIASKGGILSKCAYGYKVLGNGSVTKKVTVQAAAFSQSAKEAIEAAGGKAEVV